MTTRTAVEVAAALTHLMSAAGDDAVFPTSAATDVGLATSTLDRLVRDRTVVRLARGWYTLPSDALTPKERHRRTALALIRRHDGRVVASHYTALVLHGAPLLGEDLARVHVTHRHKESQSSTGGHVLHGRDASVEGLSRDATAVPLPHAVVQAGHTCGPLAALIAADFGLHAGLHTTDDLAAAVAEHRRRAGVGAVRSALAHAHPGAESPAETAARYALRLAGHAPEPQHEVRVEGRTYRLDLALPECGIAVEVDGRAKYRTGAGAVDLTASQLRDRVMREKARAAALHRAGWIIARLTWAECVSAHHTPRVDNVDRILRGFMTSRSFSPPAHRAS